MIDSWHALERLFLDKFSTSGTITKTRGDLANIKQKEDESLLSYLERFKKTYDEIEGINQDTVITCFEGYFRSRILYTELQQRKSETIGEMFSIAWKVALPQGSTQDSQFKRKDRYREVSLPPVHRKGKNRTRKIETFTPLNVPKES